MEILEQINKALEMISGHDWYWTMADYGYEARERSAKASMRRFVKFVKEIGDKEVEESLRKLWVLKYKGKWEDTTEEYNKEKERLIKKYSEKGE